MATSDIRKRTRLSYWHYGRTGYYFLTICCAEGRCFLGRVNGADIELTRSGKIVLAELKRIVELRPHWELIDFVIMPNHVHLILAVHKQHGDVEERVGYLRPHGTREPDSVSSVIAGFKARVTSEVRRESQGRLWIFWQRGFHDHIIRSEEALLALRQYILDNPKSWLLDRYNSERDPNGPKDRLELILQEDLGCLREEAG